jgi:hypothetical protein
VLPELDAVGAGHYVACHRIADLAPPTFATPPISG